MNIKEEFTKDLAYIEEQFRLIEDGLDYEATKDKNAGSLQKISHNIKERFYEILQRIESEAKSRDTQALETIFGLEKKESERI